MQGSLKGGAGIGIESPTDRLFRNPEHQSDAAFCGESRSWTYEIPAVAQHQKDFWDFSSGKQHKNRWQKHERGRKTSGENDISGGEWGETLLAPRLQLQAQTHLLWSRDIEWYQITTR